jgi:hypothetical protein
VFLATVLALGLLLAAVDGGSYAVIPRSEAFVVVSWSLTLGLTVGVLPRARPSKWLSFALLGLIGLAFWIGLSLLWTESSERTVIELTRVLGLVSVLVTLAVTIRTSDWNAVVAALTCVAAVVCLIALFARLAPAAVANPLNVAGLARRLSYPLNYWNALGCWAAMTVALALAWSVQAREWPVRGAALAATCLGATVAYLTFSRSAAAGLAIGSVAVVALVRQRWLAAAQVVRDDIARLRAAAKKGKFADIERILEKGARDDEKSNSLASQLGLKVCSKP